MAAQAKQIKTEGGGGLAAAMTAARPPLGPGMVPGLVVPQLTAEQAKAAAVARLQQQQQQQRQQQFTPIVRPATEDEREFVPRPRLQVG